MMNSVISCPKCLRQYRIDPPVHGRLATCLACKSRFVMSVATPAPDSGEAVVLDSPIEPHYVFFREGCAEMAKHARVLLRAGGERGSSRNIREFVRTTPAGPEQLRDEHWRESYCSRVMEIAYRYGKDDPEIRSALDYCTGHVPRLTSHGHWMLVGAFLGVLGEEYDPATGPEVPIAPRKRWFSRRPTRC